MFYDENSNTLLESCDLGESLDIPVAQAFLRIILLLIAYWVDLPFAAVFLVIDDYKLEEVLLNKLLFWLIFKLFSFDIALILLD